MDNHPVSVLRLAVRQAIASLDSHNGKHIVYKNENKKMSTLRKISEGIRVPQSLKSSRWVGSFLQPLRTILSAAVVCTIIISTGAESDGGASRNNGRTSSSDIQITGEQVRNLPRDGTEGEELAFGPRPQNGTESGSTVRGLQPGDRVPARRSELMYFGSEVSHDLKCLTTNIYWEARNQSTAGQVAVAQVTLNRVQSALYPDTVCGVVYEYKQFSWYWDGKSDVPQEAEAWDRAEMVAQGVLAGSGHAKLMNEHILHYHALYVNPRWNRGMQLVARIGDHVFYDGGP